MMRLKRWLWQARVQRQVTRTGLEAADDHAQQVEVTLGQQGHRLIQADTRRDQCMAKPLLRRLSSS